MSKQAPSWFFAPLGGGEESGLNDSGIEAFKRSESLARETCQNILDHPDGSGKPCVAVFEHMDMPASELPGREELVEIFGACRDHVLGLLPDGTGNESRFFDRALELLQGERIPVLRIGDENTTGLDGGDDDRTRPFWRLIRGQGFSSLQGPGGGTYGIGQRAPFARSALRTVIYSTLVPSGEQAFVAKAILASHPSPRDPQRRMTQSKGWFCHADEDGNWKSVRDPSLIPPRFHRNVVGTDVWVTGHDEPDWEQRIRHGVLQSFFSAIARKLLVVRIMKDGKLLTTIDSENLEEMLILAADEARRTQTATEYRKGLGATIYYLPALRNPVGGAPFSTSVPQIGNVNLYVHRDTADPHVPERWAVMRRPMMVVEDHGSSLLSRFAAVVVCDTEEGNQFLAQMEDPRHSRWHEDEARNWTPAEKKRGRDVRLAIDRFVKDTLKQIRSAGMPECQDVPYLGRYLPADDDATDAAEGAATKPTGDITAVETGHTTVKPASGTVAGRARRSRRDVIRLPRGESEEGEETGGSVTEGQAGVGGGPEPPGGPQGPAGGKHGRGSGEGPGSGQENGRGEGPHEGNRGGQASGAEQGEAATVAGQGEAETGPGTRRIGSSDVRFRSFATGNTYCLVLESRGDVVGEIELRAVGEDSRYKVSLRSARDLTRGASLRVNGARVYGIALKGGRASRIEVAIEDALPLCLTLGN